MKKNFIFLLIYCLSFPISSKASHCAGGEIVYKHLPNTPDSVYHFTFKLYRDCSGTSAEPATVPLCYRNSCTGFSSSVTLTKSATISGGGANGSQVQVGCSSFPTTCTQTGSGLPGYQEWWYEGDVTLPSRCEHWEFSAAISARNASVNLGTSTSNVFYIKASLNNMLAQGNSSPSFTVKPVPYVCLNVPYTFNNGVQDADGDSLVYSMQNPLKGSATDCADSGSSLPYANATPAYNTTTNPLACANSFVLNQFGQLSFMPAQLGKYTLTMVVKEYRNHQLIGSAMRDIQVQVLACNNAQPVVNFDTSNVTGGQWVSGRIEMCANKQLHFCLGVSTNVATTIYVASDNHSFSAPGATVNYTGQLSNNIQGCFDWTPGNLDTGLHVFTITVKDSTCLPPGVAPSNTYSYPIYIAPVANIDRDTSICLGDTVRLIASGGSAFVWTALPGGSGTNSLSCTTCNNPFAFPTVTTKYVVTTNVVSLCNRNKDTVTVVVNINPNVPLPTVNSPVCVGQTLQFHAGVTANSFIWSGPAGFNATSANPTIANAQLPNTGAYTVRAVNGTCKSAPVTINATVAYTPDSPVITSNSPVCQGSPLVITASANGTCSWTGPAGFVFTGNTVNIPAAKLENGGQYTVIATNPANAACSSKTSHYTVVVTPNITADFTVSKDTFCVHDSININYTGTGAYTNLNWDFGNGTILSGLGAGPFNIAYDTVGLQTIYLVSTKQNCYDSIAKLIKIQPIPSSGFRAQPDACIGEEIKITANRDVSNNLNFTWDFAGANVFSGSSKGVYSLYYTQPGYKIITLKTNSETCTSLLTADTVYVHPYPTAKIDFLTKNDICSGDTVVVRAVDTNIDNSFTWTPSIVFYENNASYVAARVPNSGFLKVLVKDSYGCKATDSIYVNTHPCCDVYLPNAFTPNGDGRNDLFRIITKGHHLISGFRIFNRWGQMVFETAEEGVGWDGTHAGAIQEAGTYFYYLRYKCANDQYFEQKGELTLIR